MENPPPPPPRQEYMRNYRLENIDKEKERRRIEVRRSTHELWNEKRTVLGMRSNDDFASMLLKTNFLKLEKMPIAIRDYTWEETETEVHITVPIKGNNSSKADLFSSNDYIKVNSPPYLFEVFLHACVDDSKSVAQLGDGVIVFKMTKEEPGLWGRLSSAASGDKDKMRERRQDAVAKAHKRSEQELLDKKKKKREKEKMALNEQMRLENEERQMIQDTKEAEIRQVTDELEDWKRRQRLPSDEPHPAFTGHDDGDDEQEEDDDDVAGERSLEDEKALMDKLPPPRSRQNITVTFTPRVFPTPMRESRIPEEEEWLKKQAEARRLPEVEDEELSAEERNPFWLKDKGDSFFKGGNFQAAINAYNTAIRLNGKVPAFYSNRAACHLKLRNFIKSVEDSSKAIELLTPVVPANASSRLRAHIRRGTAFCELELYAEGLQDYEAALKIDPENQQLKQDAERIRHVIQGTTESDR